MTSFNHFISKSVIYKDLNFINSLFIKEINYFAFELSAFIKNYSLKDFITTNNVFLNKENNCLNFFIRDNFNFDLIIYIVLNYY